ncbi:hypothetical protein FHG87_024965, partial [Trinorchestia longiramus]
SESGGEGRSESDGGDESVAGAADTSSAAAAATADGSSAAAAATADGSSAAAAATAGGSSAAAAATAGGSSAAAAATADGSSAATAATDDGSSAAAAATDDGSSAAAAATDDGSSAAAAATDDGSSAAAAATDDGSSAAAAADDGNSAVVLVQVSAVVAQISEKLGNGVCSVPVETFSQENVPFFSPPMESTLENEFPEVETTSTELVYFLPLWYMRTGILEVPVRLLMEQHPMECLDGLAGFDLNILTPSLSVTGTGILDSAGQDVERVIPVRCRINCFELFALFLEALVNESLVIRTGILERRPFL